MGKGVGIHLHAIRFVGLQLSSTSIVLSCFGGNETKREEIGEGDFVWRPKGYLRDSTFFKDLF